MPLILSGRPTFNIRASRIQRFHQHFEVQIRRRDNAEDISSVIDNIMKMQKANGEIGCLSPTGMSDEFKDEARKLLLRKCLESLVHACQCRDANCHLSSCRKLKRVLQHSKNCKRQTVDGCQICKQFFTLCICHAKTCQMEKCPVAFCYKIKQKLEKQRMQKLEEEKEKSPVGTASSDGAGSSGSDNGAFLDATGKSDSSFTSGSQSESSNSISESVMKEQFLGSTDF